MGTSRKIVGRLQRITGAEAKSAGPPIETPNAPKGTAAEGARARHLALKPEELISLGKIVLNEQLLPFKPDPSPAAVPPRAPQAPQDPVSHDPPVPEPEPVRKDYTVSNIETILKDAMQ